MDTKDLFAAIEYGDDNLCRELLKKSVNVNARNEDGWTPLHVAACYDRVNACLALLDRGANIHFLDNYGWTPLHAAARCGNLNVCSVLLERGAHIEAMSNIGWTPLHMAAYYDRIEMCLALLEFGAHIEVMDKDGNTALSRAVQNKRFEVCLALVACSANSKGIQSNDKDFSAVLKMTPLQAAVSLGRLPLLRKVIEADPESDTLPVCVKQLLDLSGEQDRTNVMAFMRSWLAQQAVQNLLNNKHHKKDEKILGMLKPCSLPSNMGVTR